MKNDGGPAFPLMVAWPNGQAEVQYGMSVRDYLAAHAPSEPQFWFQPVLSGKWSKKPEIPTGLQPATVALLRSWVSDPHWDISSSDCDDRDANAVAQFVADLKAHWAHNDALRKEQQEQRLLQWPYAWADAVLLARDAANTLHGGES